MSGDRPPLYMNGELDLPTVFSPLGEVMPRPIRMMTIEKTRPTIEEIASKRTYWNQDLTLYKMRRAVSVAE